MITPTFPNSAFVSAPQRFVLKNGRWHWIKIPVRYGYFEHASLGRCLIDTGYSARVTLGKRSFPLRLYSRILRPKLTHECLPENHTEIDTIFLTHLHADHVSALKDYPNARIFADGDATQHFLNCSTFARTRHGCFKELLPNNMMERLTPFESCSQVKAPFGLGQAADILGDGKILAVPLPGHMRGHTGILFTDTQAEPLLYAGDAEWLRTAIVEDRSPGYPARAILNDKAAARETVKRLQVFSKSGGKIVLCHDPEETL